jgi:hypothetical protein
MKSKFIKDFKSFVNENYKINEGGGAGIRFQTKCSVSGNIQIHGVDDISVNLDISPADSFDAHGYQEGLSNVDTRLIDFELPVITYDKLKNILLDKQPIESYINRGETVELEYDITVDYDSVYGAGYMRSNVEIGTPIFDASKDYYPYCVTDGSRIYFTIGDEHSTDGYDYDNDMVKLVSPIGYANDEFINFYEDVFDYNGSSDEDDEDGYDYDTHYDDLVINYGAK